MTGAAFLAGRGRRGLVAVLLGLGGLTRETALLGAVTLLPPGRPSLHSWVRAAGWTVLCAVPLAAWQLYLRSVVSAPDAGLHNIMVPVAGWVAKWGEVAHRLRTEPDHYLALTGLLAHLGLTVQAAYLIWRPKPQDVWWRLGAVYVGLMLFLSTSVWHGQPGAATRLLLPLALVFNVLAVRERAGAVWLVLGNLSVLSGVLVFWTVPHNPHELAAGRTAGGAYVALSDARWYPTEHGRDNTWAWCAQVGGMGLKTWPRSDGPVKIQVAVRGITARPLEIRQDRRVLWQGEVTEKLQWITLPVVALVQGRAQLELASSTPPSPLGASGDPRPLGFAVYGVRVD